MKDDPLMEVERNHWGGQKERAAAAVGQHPRWVERSWELLSQRYLWKIDPLRAVRSQADPQDPSR